MPTVSSHAKKVAVLLAGCGYLDGAEINEAVMTLLALRQEGFEPVAFALDRELFDHVDHRSGQTLPQASSRRAINEAARIVRGQIQSLDAFKVSSFDALAMPGGFGVAKNFCDFAFKGASAQVNSQVEEVVKAFFDARKPILAVCIAPAVVGLVAAKAKKLPLTLTLGDAKNEASLELQKLGLELKSAGPGEVVVDERARVVSTPAYMHDITLDQAWPGIQKAAHQLRTWVSA
jgi:enhancing lycopene biosynthesis protein 2